MIQSFGSWFGVESTLFDTAHMDEDWTDLRCKCGEKMHRMGTFTRGDVRMTESGHWILRECFDHNARGTILRPTIRALDATDEMKEDQTWQSR